MVATKRKASTAAKKTSTRKTAKTKTSRTASGSKRRWSARVTERSDALDLRSGVFSQNGPKKIAASLKRSAERSRRRKSDPYRSAMSMLTFYMNRAGKTLPAARKRKLNQAKEDLRELFHKD